MPIRCQWILETHLQMPHQSLWILCTHLQSLLQSPQTSKMSIWGQRTLPASHQSQGPL